MIKIFRKIRQKLLSENKFSKYLIYAIGEIVLVVIGILMALQINNWNQNRINEDLEFQYYNRLLDDVKEEKLIIESIINYSKQVSDHAKRAIVVFENHSNANANPVESVIDMYQASQYTDAYSASSTYNELIASGQINLLKNDSLKTALIRYYDINWSQIGSFRFQNKYRENLRGKMPNEIQAQIRTHCGDVFLKNSVSYLISLPNECDINLDLKTAKNVVNELRKDESLKKDLRYLIGNEAARLNDIKPTQSQLEGLINILEQINRD